MWNLFSKNYIYDWMQLKPRKYKIKGESLSVYMLKQFLSMNFEDLLIIKLIILNKKDNK